MNSSIVDWKTLSTAEVFLLTRMETQPLSASFIPQLGEAVNRMILIFSVRVNDLWLHVLGLSHRTAITHAPQ